MAKVSAKVQQQQMREMMRMEKEKRRRPREGSGCIEHRDSGGDGFGGRQNFGENDRAAGGQHRDGEASDGGVASSSEIEPDAKRVRIVSGESLDACDEQDGDAEERTRDSGGGMTGDDGEMMRGLKSSAGDNSEGSEERTGGPGGVAKRGNTGVAVLPWERERWAEKLEEQIDGVRYVAEGDAEDELVIEDGPALPVVARRLGKRRGRGRGRASEDGGNGDIGGALLGTAYSSSEEGSSDNGDDDDGASGKDAEMTDARDDVGGEGVELGGVSDRLMTDEENDDDEDGYNDDDDDGGGGAAGRTKPTRSEDTTTAYKSQIEALKHQREARRLQEEQEAAEAAALAVTEGQPPSSSSSSSSTAAAKESIPLGFFDDADKDATARGMVAPSKRREEIFESELRIFESEMRQVDKREESIRHRQNSRRVEEDFKAQHAAQALLENKLANLRKRREALQAEGRIAEDDSAPHDGNEDDETHHDEDDEEEEEDVLVAGGEWWRSRRVARRQ